MLDGTIAEISTLIQSRQLFVATEDQVAHAVLSWLNHSSGRHQHAAALFAQLKLGFLSADYVAGLSGHPLDQQLREAALAAVSGNYERRSSYEMVVVALVHSCCRLVFLQPQSVHCCSVRCPAPPARCAIPAVHAGSSGDIVITTFRSGQTGLTTEVFRYHAAADQWVPLAPCSLSMSKMSLFFGGTDLYAIGEERLYCHHEEPSRWEARKEKPTRIGDSGHLVYAGQLYIFGGLVDAPGGRSAATDRVLRYDPLPNKWSELARMPTARYRPQVCAASDGLIYVVGGYTDFPTSAGLNCVEAFDVNDNKWHIRRNLTTDRETFGLVLWNGQLSALGGLARRPGQADAGPWMEQYDTASDTWTAAATAKPAAMTNGDVGCVAIPRFSAWLTVLQLPTQAVWSNFSAS
ncbi:kelch-like protein diablo [Paramacrobiotus metropolitanus]|uniref:kelch-like protein diablo n=1 Tax=Paramacrobiotus metropolitanus TaxID=2943436 RepID=UPI0024463D34|nr:kelch-like protein diablo [Paramacrobiotus metropolitanus]